MAYFYSIMVGVLLIACGAFEEATNPPSDSASEKTAIAELKKLGAIVVFRKSTANREDKDRETEQEVRFVLIDENWNGGDEGLKQIEQLPRLSKLFIQLLANLLNEGL